MPEIDQDRAYWFPAKRYGWGWGPPRVWQGWAVTIGFAVLLGLGTWLFPPATMLPRYLVFVAVLTVLLVGICWLKGEPPRWRWGGEE